jgi:cell division septation protein DedD
VTQPAKPAEQVADATPADARESVPAKPAFAMTPYRTTVGAAGWALHLYSFPDQAGTDAELAELRRRGFETEVRVVETQAKGRWWRIYVGSFATKAEARAAAPLLKKKLRTDWANPTRF